MDLEGKRQFFDVKRFCEIPEINSCVYLCIKVVSRISDNPKNLYALKEVFNEDFWDIMVEDTNRYDRKIIE